jgi:putative transposase
MEVSRSGFYEWRDRPASATAERREELKAFIRTSFEESDGTYGHRRVHADLAGWGVPCGPELVRSLMRELGLEPCQPQPWRLSLTEQDGKTHHIPDLVRRDFTADAPGVKMVGDITYIETWEGWVYLATVLDCHTKAVIGWAMDDNYKTPLIEKAIAMAARNHKLADQAIFHSDRGSNGTSEQFAKVLKNERVHRTQYPTRAHAYRDIARYIELRHNSRRRHSALGYRTPQQVHDDYMARQLTA